MDSFPGRYRLFLQSIEALTIETLCHCQKGMAYEVVNHKIPDPEMIPIFFQNHVGFPSFSLNDSDDFWKSNVWSKYLCDKRILGQNLIGLEI